VIVEAALITPILLLLIFGAIDFGTLYNQNLAIHQGTSAGARQAIVSTSPGPPGGGGGGWGPGNCQTTSNIVANTDGYDLICFTKNRIGLNEANVRVSIQFAVPWTMGQGVTFCTMYPATSTTGALSSFLSGVLSSKVEMRIEQPVSGTSTFTAPVQENALPGATWPAACSST
jgi:hypothetical protein